MLLPLVMPVIGLATSLFVLFRQLDIELSWKTVVAGHVVIAMPFALLVILPRVQQLDRALEEAARDLGAGPFRAFRRVTLPLIAPAIVSSLIIVCTISFDEFVIALFTAGTDTTFPLYLVSQLRFPDRLPQVMAVTVIVIFVSATIVIAAEVGRRAFERRWERTP
jgi:spermidine/putrescine transport system permease protein